jgi:hypothetical protein
LNTEQYFHAKGIQQQIKLEMLLFFGLFALGMWLVPAMIYVVGVKILGPYGELKSLSAFYIDLFSMLVEKRRIAWLLVASPYLFLSLVRVLIWLWGVAQRAASTPDQETSEQ